MTIIIQNLAQCSPLGVYEMRNKHQPKIYGAMLRKTSLQHATAVGGTLLNRGRDPFMIPGSPIERAPRLRAPRLTQDPVVHVSVASVLGDVSTYVGSSSEGAPSPLAARVASGAPKSAGVGEGSLGGDDSVDDSSGEEKDEEDVPSEICLPVSAVLCKAGTTCFEAPLVAGR